MSQAEIEDDLQYGLNDLRLIVDSMDHSDSSLESAMTTFQARAKVQLRAANIELIWQESTPFISVNFGPAIILNIYRFMQEAVTNAIRHANCNQLIITISRMKVADELVIAVADNGVGFDTYKEEKAGQGLKNMAFRAKAIGGTFIRASSQSGGAEIKLTISITQEAPS